MAVRARITTKGMEETLEALVQAGRDIDALASQGLDAAGNVLLAGMQKRVPRDTGNLHDSLSVAGPFRDGNYHYVAVGLNADVDAETARYGTAQEYGWGPDHPGQPFIRPAVDEDMSKARRALLDTLKSGLGGGA